MASLIVFLLPRRSNWLSRTPASEEVQMNRRSWYRIENFFNFENIGCLILTCVWQVRVVFMIVSLKIKEEFLRGIGNLLQIILSVFFSDFDTI